MNLPIVIALAAAASVPKVPMSYVVIDAVTAGEGQRKPERIAFCSEKSNCIHVPVNRYIFPIKPGTYELDHIDFFGSKSEVVRVEIGAGGIIDIEGPIVFPDGFLHMDAAENTIHYVGVLRVFKRGFKVHIDINNDGELIKNACSKKPELFSDFPVRFEASLDPNKEYRYRCHSVE
ncbi:hypothetical protein [Microbulbifer hainanensis]|uniref:hypothetical protein n=1 Tax=Microbulbifer hainanensis TaxID=2735675 RepID=UPI001866D200|nr:hypothetical protein [Microbulbifer hainanensis]